MSFVCWNSRLKCPVCDQDIATTEMSSHFERSHQKKRCPKCSYVANGSTDFEVHSQICEYHEHRAVAVPAIDGRAREEDNEPSQSSSGFICVHCDKILATSKSLQTHIDNLHVSARCGRCDEVIRLRDMLAHMTVTHPGMTWIEAGRTFDSAQGGEKCKAKRFKCSSGNCKRRFATKASLDAHTASNHQVQAVPVAGGSGRKIKIIVPANMVEQFVANSMSLMVESFICFNCSAVFHTKSALMHHLSAVHEEDIAYEADIKMTNESAAEDRRLVEAVTRRSDAQSLMEYTSFIVKRLRHDADRAARVDGEANNVHDQVEQSNLVSSGGLDKDYVVEEVVKTTSCDYDNIEMVEDLEEDIVADSDAESEALCVDQGIHDYKMERRQEQRGENLDCYICLRSFSSDREFASHECSDQIDGLQFGEVKQRSQHDVNRNIV